MNIDLTEDEAAVLRQAVAHCSAEHLLRQPLADRLLDRLNGIDLSDPSDRAGCGHVMLDALRELEQRCEGRRPWEDYEGGLGDLGDRDVYLRYLTAAKTLATELAEQREGIE